MNITYKFAQSTVICVLNVSNHTSADGDPCINLKCLCIQNQRIAV